MNLFKSLVTRHLLYYLKLYLHVPLWEPHTFFLARKYFKTYVAKLTCFETWE